MNMLSLKKDLSEKELMLVELEFQKHKKSTLAAYLLFFFFGAIGMHKFYIEDKKHGLQYLASFLCIWISMVIFFVSKNPLFLIIYMIILVTFSIMLMIDLFTIPKQVNKSNEMIEIELIECLKHEKLGD